MKLTTLQIIKYLPFEKTLKDELVNSWSTMDPDKKFNLEQLVWDAYDALYDLKLQENIQLALLRAQENNETLDKDFYKRVEEQTDKEMETETFETTSSVELDQVRSKLELLMNKH